ncbi:MAG: hypothetical protein IJ137_03030 [Eubacterium sp.]|nr:hypothetical protein [Eubacterium sp.]
MGASILNIADEVIVLRDGQLVRHGSRDEVLPELMGTASMVSECKPLAAQRGGNC